MVVTMTMTTLMAMRIVMILKKVQRLNRLDQKRPNRQPEESTVPVPQVRPAQRELHMAAPLYEPTDLVQLV